MTDDVPTANENNSKEDGGSVIDLRAKQEERLKRSGEFTFAVCPYCNDESAGFAPIIVYGPGGKIVIAGLMCVSQKCAGDTVIDVVNGIMSDARPFI